MVFQWAEYLLLIYEAILTVLQVDLIRSDTLAVKRL